MTFSDSLRFTRCFVKLFLVLIASYSSDTWAAPIARSSITQYGITWKFDKDYPTGQFANGDYWVVGPITITEMTPTFNGTHNGFEINPDATTYDTQSYDGRGKGFDSSKLPSLPFLAAVNTSIVKAISFTDDESIAQCYPTSFHPKCLETAAVLTVLPSAPAGDGLRYLRPPYPGPEKPLFSIDQVPMTIFSRFAVPSGVTLPTAASLAQLLRRPQIDHKPNGVLNEHTQPFSNLPTYSPSQYQQYGNAFGRLFFKDLTAAEREDLLTVVLQAGSDRFYAAKHARQTWPGGSGITPAKKMMIGVFVSLLGDQQMQDYFSSISFFDEDKTIAPGKNNQGLYGTTVTEDVYWKRFLGDSVSNTSHGDFYGYTDGGGKVNDDADNYQYCCRAEPWRGGLVALKLIPRLGQIWTNAALLESYMKRYLASGLQYQPDPCAPAEGICVGGQNENQKCTSANMSTACPQGQCDFAIVKSAKYRVSYGPNGSGGCILDADPSDGIGRLPMLHGKKYSFNYSSSVISLIWNNFSNEFLTQGPAPKNPTNLLIQN